MSYAPSEKLAVKLAVLWSSAFFMGWLITTLLVTRLPDAFGPSGTLAVAGIVLVCSALCIVTIIAALVDHLAIKLYLFFTVDFFLLGLIFALYFVYPGSATRLLLALLPMVGVMALYVIVTYLRTKVRALRHSRQP